MAKEMSVDEAVRIITETNEFGDKFDEAVAYLQEHDAQNSLLVQFKDEQSALKIKKERAQAYIQQAAADEEYDARFDEAVKLVRDDDKIQAQVKDEQEVFDKENHLDMADEDAVLRNTQKIAKMADSFLDDKDNAKEIESDKEKIDVVDDSGQPLSADEAQKYWDTLLESAKQQAVMLRAGDVNFFMKKEEEKRQTLNRDIKDFWAIGVATGVVGSAMDTPTEKQVNPNSKEYAQYVKSQADKAEKALVNLFGNGQKAKIKTDYFLHNAVETSKKMASYAHRWLQKGFNKVSAMFTKRRESFDSKMKGVFGKAYEVKQAAVEHIKNNKTRLIVDTAATLAVTAAAGTGLALPAIAGYALYTAAGSWTWPLVEKKTKAVREAKKAGLDASEWTGFNGLKKAFASIKSDEKEYKKYKNRAYTGTAFGIAGAGLVAGMGAASGWAVDKAGYMTAKVTSSVVRSIGSVTSQGLNYRDVKKDFKADPSAENRAKLKQAKISLGLGAGIAFVGNMLAFGNVVKANAAENSGGVMDKVKNWFHKDEPVATDSATVAPNDSAVVNKAAVAEQTTDGGANNVANTVDANAVVSAPADYDASMGISEKHWNEMHQKLTGIYENHSAIFGRENVSAAEAWDKMYQNLDNAMKANPDYFGKMTKEQFLYKYMKLIENTERVTNGVKGFLVTKLDKDGLPMYGDKDLTKAIRDMNAMLNCGEKFKVSATEIGKALDYVDDKTGRYMGPGAEIGMTNNLYVGGRTGCGDDYQNAWKHAVRKVIAHHHAAPKPVVEPEPVVEVPEKKPVNVEEVVSNETPSRKPVHVNEEVVNTQPAARKVVINEGATDGNLDVNSNKVRVKSRSFAAARGGNER